MRTPLSAGSTNGTDISGFALLINEWRQSDTNADAELTAYRAGSTNGTDISGFASLDSTNGGNLDTKLMQN